MQAIRELSAILSVVGLLCCLTLHQTATRSRAEQDVRPLPEFRSAFLLRERPLAANAPLSRAEQRTVLQRHFDCVIEVLESNSEISLSKALARLQAARGEEWSSTERAAQRRRLARNRRQQIDRLRAYRDRGRFPQNEGHAPYAVPIFVDNHGTACAVGHLMRLSGHEEEAAHVAAANNLVYVPDATSGPLVEWILTSGLTQEEAALIQPGYEPPPGQIQLGDLLVEGAAFERAGLRFENFRYSKRSFTTTVDPFLCELLGGEHCRPALTELPEAEEADLSDLVMSSHIGEYYSPYDHVAMEVEGTNWIRFGNAAYWRHGTSLGIESAPGLAHSLTLAFDVTAVAPGHHIEGVYLNNHPWFDGGWIAEGGTDDGGLYISSTIQAGEESLGELRVSADTYVEPMANFIRRDGTSIPPVKEIHVETEILATDSARIHALVFEFDLSPPPELLVGDFNHDGMIDRTDVATWQQLAGAMRMPFEPPFRDWSGNTDGDRDIDGHDLVNALLNFGRRSVPLTATAIPEPSGKVLAAVLLVLLMARSLRRAFSLRGWCTVTRSGCCCVARVVHNHAHPSAGAKISVD